jgi:hypothetical protein
MLTYMQSFPGSAKTRTLVLAIRDYLVERVEASDKSLLDLGKAPLSPNLAPKRPDEDQDPDMGKPLPDGWVIEHLRSVKHLRCLQCASSISVFSILANIATQ